MRDINDIIADYLASEPLADGEREALAVWMARGGEECRVATCRELPGAVATARARYLYDRERGFREIRARARRREVIAIGVSAVACAVVLLGVIAGVIALASVEREEQPGVAGIVPGSPRAELRLSSGQRVALSSGERLRIRDEITCEENILTYTGSDEGREGNGGNRDTLVVPPGGEYILALADGTRVYLNSSSALIYPSPFPADRREVELRGEAYFEVKTDAARPFAVKAGAVTVEALGTSFNVNARETRRVVAMTLESGRVRVSAGGASREALPGEQVVYDRETGALASRAVETGLYTSWRSGYYLFRETPLEEIMETLATWYDVNVIYMDDRARATRFTGRLQRAGDIRYLLDKFMETGAITVSAEGNDVIIGR